MERPEHFAKLMERARQQTAPGSFDTAERLLREVLAADEARLGPDSPGTADVAFELARVLREAGQYRASVVAALRAVRLEERRTPANRTRLREYRNCLAVTLLAIGEYAAAETILARLLDEAVGDGAPDREIPQYAIYRGLSLTRLARFAEAESLLRGTLVTLLASGPDDQLAWCMLRFGDLCRALGANEQALALIRAALMTNTARSDAQLSASANDALAATLCASGELLEARALAEKTLAERDRPVRASHPDVAQSLATLAEIRLAAEEWPEAIPLLERARAIWRRSTGERSLSIADTLEGLSTAHFGVGDSSLARIEATEALSIRSDALGSGHPLTARCQTRLGRIELAGGEVRAALIHLERAIIDLREVFRHGHVELASTLESLASAYTADADDTRATNALLEARLMRERPVTVDIPELPQHIAVVMKLDRFIKPIQGDMAALSDSRNPIGRINTWFPAPFDAYDSGVLGSEPLVSERAQDRPARRRSVVQPLKRLFTFPARAPRRPRSPAAPPLVEVVRFAVSHADAMAPGISYVLDAWIFPSDAAGQLLEQARRESNESVRLKSQGPARLKHGTRVGVRVHVRGLRITPAFAEIHWLGEIANTSFTAEVPADVIPGTLPGEAIFSIEGCDFARMAFNVVVGERSGEPQLVQSDGNVRTKAFASYASADRRQVLPRVHGLQKAGIDVFVDVNSLRSGQRYKEVLMDMIRTYDVFYLFWSRAARASEWVDREWRCAYESRGIAYIDPVPLESPEVAPPPKELADSLHFNDWILAYLESDAARRSWWRFWAR